MREIKFRQWVSDFKMMHYGIGVEKEGAWAGPPSVTFSTNPLMQFTGLHDKNGKEIWEGDIVTIIDLSKCHPIRTANVGTGIVTWDDEQAKFCNKGNFYKGFFEMFDGWEWEVIGNIYEVSN